MPTPLYVTRKNMLTSQPLPRVLGEAFEALKAQSIDVCVLENLRTDADVVKMEEEGKK